jgi:hypothetical protein
LSDIIKLKQDILKNGSLNDNFRHKIDLLDKDSALALFAELISKYNQHKNLFLAIQLTDEIIKRKAMKYLNVLLDLKKQIVPKSVSLSLKNRLYMNIELLDLEANTDIDRIKCPCGIYAKYNEHPESCPDFKIISKNDLGGGFVNYFVYKAKCLHCARIYKIEMQEASANKMEISWALDEDDD